MCCTGTAIQAGSFDQRRMESRSDVLVYTSEAFTDGLELSGPITPTLYVSSDAKDTDFTVKVLDVYPDGRAYNLDESIQRMRYRDGYDKPLVWMEKDKVYKVTLQPLNTSNYFAPGHRLRIEVSSSNFPRFDRNMNTGGNNYDESHGRRRAQRGAPLEAVPVEHHDHGGEEGGDVVADVAGTMPPRIARVILGVLCPGYLLIYLFVLVVALATSGTGLVGSAGAWYAAIAPVFYVSLAGAYAYRLVSRRFPMAAWLALHVLMLPALAFSFLGLGLLLPVFSGLWWWMSREQAEPA